MDWNTFDITDAAFTVSPRIQSGAAIVSFARHGIKLHIATGGEEREAIFDLFLH